MKKTNWIKIEGISVLVHLNKDNTATHVFPFGPNPLSPSIFDNQEDTLSARTAQSWRESVQDYPEIYKYVTESKALCYINFGDPIC